MPPKHQGIDNLDFVPEQNHLGLQHLTHVGTSIPMVTATTVVPAEATIPLVTAHSTPPPGFESGSASQVYSPIDVSRLANVLYHHPDRL